MANERSSVKARAFGGTAPNVRDEEREQALEDEEDLAALQARKDEPSIPWEEAKKKLGL